MPWFRGGVRLPAATFCCLALTTQPAPPPATPTRGRTHELEADEFATAVCMRLGFPLDQLTTSMRAILLEETAAAKAIAAKANKALAADAKSRSTEGRAALAAELGCLPADVERELERLQDDPASLQRYARRLQAQKLLRAAAEQAAAGGAAAGTTGEGGGDREAGSAEVKGSEGGGDSTATATPAQPTFRGSPVVGTVGKSLVTQHVLDSCPEAACEALLMSLGSTHPPTDTRIERIAAVARTPAFLTRYAAPAVPVGGVYAQGKSVAELVADRMAASIRAQEAAAAAARKARWQSFARRWGGPGPAC